MQKGDSLSAQQHAVNFEKLFERSGGALMQRRQSSATAALNKFKGTGFTSSGFVDKDVASNIQDVNSAYSDLLGLQGEVIDATVMSKKALVSTSLSRCYRGKKART